MSWRAHRRLLRAAAPVALALAAAPAAARTLAPAAARTLAPARGSVFLGVSDRGTASEFDEFASLTGKHPALLETFHPWGTAPVAPTNAGGRPEPARSCTSRPPTTRRWPS
jgi:hypothetical protein